MFTYFRVFVDGKQHGDVKANAEANRNGYHYALKDLKPDQIYDVTVKVRLWKQVWRHNYSILYVVTARVDLKEGNKFYRTYNTSLKLHPRDLNKKAETRL